MSNQDHMSHDGWRRGLAGWGTVARHGCGGSSPELSSPTAPVGETRCFLFLSNHRGLGSSPGRVFGDVKL
jgi:hypothetical protein